jgi:hypothetical protein
LDTDHFVRKLRASVQQPDRLLSVSQGYCSLVSASLRLKFPENRRIGGLTAVLENCLLDLLADAKAGGEPDLQKMMTVLDAIEFHLDKFEAEAG